MSTQLDSYPELLTRLRAFVSEREWAQFHSPKNLTMALTGELGELVEHFQWLRSEDSESLEPDTLREVRRELADIQIYLMLLSDRLGVNLMGAVGDKIKENEEKYPAERARGRSNKYNDL